MRTHQLVLAVLAGAWYSTSAFPMQQTPSSGSASPGAGPLEQQAQAITPENPVPRRLVSTNAVYPAEAAAISAMIVVFLIGADLLLGPLKNLIISRALS